MLREDFDQHPGQCLSAQNSKENQDQAAKQPWLVNMSCTHHAHLVAEPLLSTGQPVRDLSLHLGFAGQDLMFLNSDIILLRCTDTVKYD